MQIVNSINSKNSYLVDNFMTNKKMSILKDMEAHEKPSSKHGSLVVNEDSYSVFISSEARMMVSTQKGKVGKLIVSSEEGKENLSSMLGKNEDKVVSQDMKKFCVENGIDLSQVVEKLESFNAERTEEMKRKDAMYSDSLDITYDAKDFVDAFNGGSFIGSYPPEAVYTMYEKRFNRYVRNLTDYIEKYGRDQELRQTIDNILNAKNPDGTNEVANLVKEITDRIYSGDTENLDRLIKDKAKEAYEHTYKNEIADATEAERKRREKSINQLKKIDEEIEKQRESLQDQIKKLQEKILEEEKKLSATDKTENEQIRFLKKQLETLQEKLSGLPITGGMPSDNQDWSDMPCMFW